jgi:4-amino-4-deoxy-L-arabinose transferase-like glycosyltransferase
MSGVKVMAKNKCGINHSTDRLTMWDAMLKQFARAGTLLAFGGLLKPERKPRRGELASSWALAFGTLLCLVLLESTAIEVDKAQAITTRPVVTVTPQQYAKALLNDDKQYACIYELYNKESNWNYKARNGSHHGIPQLRNDIMLTKNPLQQVSLGVKYIAHRYGYIDGIPNACKALQHLKTKGWH